MDPDEVMSEQKLAEAMEVAFETEAGLAQKNGGKSGGKNGAGGHSGSPKQKRSGGPWMWTLDLDEPSVKAVEDLMNKYRPLLPVPMEPPKDFHVTLLYLGGGSDAEVASRHPNLGGPEAVARMKEDLASRAGTQMQVDATFIVWDPRIAALKISNANQISANRHPHVTLACAAGVPPRVSNELLGRLESSQDLALGLENWLQQVGLAKYAGALLEWCSAMGAATPEEIKENAADAAAAIENSSVEERNRIEEALRRAAPGELCGDALDPPLRLTGVIRSH
eukprot:SRR837773.1339.p1 GENE.SRR837773.1339~~SRR837773.1339.p1  ORF type:complete len:321 (-),score=106.11 SRR837773.1339:20-859(-)